MRSLLVVAVLCVWLQGALCRNATKTVVTEATSQGAVCLDGSPPAYYMRAGSEGAHNKWIIHMMGGGWCDDTPSCYNRSLTDLGSTSSKFWPESLQFNGFLLDNSTVNPDFHNWNMVFLIYCDGGSFAGDREEPDVKSGTKLYYRGYRILKALLGHLNEQRGLAEATDVILTGCSAGGLAVYLHADFVQTMIPHTAKYRAFPDAGYFLDIANIHGEHVVASNAKSIMELQNIYESLIPACKAAYSHMDLWKCFFAPYVFDYIKTPIFVLNSQYDTAQLKSLYELPCLPPNCTAEQMVLFKHFKEEFDAGVQPVLSSSNDGYFLDSCLIHCQTLQDVSWSKFSAKGIPMQQSFADWYFERPSPEGATQIKDCDYPCNPTCSTSDDTPFYK